MTALTRPEVLSPWADTGDKTEPSGSEVSAGWPLTGLAPSRQRFNWVLWYATQGLRYLSSRGIADYSADETYQQHALCIGDDGRIYRSRINSNTGHTPSSSPTQWEVFEADIQSAGGNISIPGGLILKTTTLSSATAGPVTWTFTDAFPTACLFAVAVPIVATPNGYDVAALASAPSSSSVQFNRRHGSAGSDFAANFSLLCLAVGW